MAALRIPKGFSLLGREYTVRVVPAKEWTEEGAVGTYQPAEALLLVKRQADTELMYWAFLHELVHAIFDALNENDLYQNEKLVDLFAGLLHQALKSAR